MIDESNTYPLVSIIVPIYNVKKYLNECIDSICNQTFTDIEIILVDDGSTDGSGTICDQYAEKDERIVVIHKENGGLVSARKIGAENARGEYCLHVDGDDWLELEAIEVIVKRIVDDDLDFVQFGWIEEGRARVYKDLYIDKLYAQKEEIVKAWMKGCPAIGSLLFNKIYKTSLFKKVYMKVSDENSFGEDQFFFLYLMCEAKRVESIHNVLYNHRLRLGSLSYAEDKLKEGFDQRILYERLRRVLVAEYPMIPLSEIQRYYYRRVFTSLRCELINNGLFIPYRQYPLVDVIRNKKIIIYGAGALGRQYVAQLSIYSDIRILAWVDVNYERYEYLFREVLPVDIVSRITDYDYIIVAIGDGDISCSVKNKLVEEYDIDESKIIWDYDKSYDIFDEGIRD